MEFRPTPEEFHCGGPDRSVTVFSTSSTTSGPASRSSMHTRAPSPACLATFVVASWSTRCRVERTEIGIAFWSQRTSVSTVIPRLRSSSASWATDSTGSADVAPSAPPAAPGSPLGSTIPSSWRMESMRRRSRSASFAESPTTSSTP